jgi:phosphoribosylpyrophosphate synthetase
MQARAPEQTGAMPPYAGALKLATYFGKALGVSAAAAAKFRPRPEQVEYAEVMGRFSEKRTALILDDILSSGGTVDALIRLLVREQDTRVINRMHDNRSVSDLFPET